MSRWKKILSLLEIIDRLASSTIDTLSILDSEIDDTLTESQLDFVKTDIQDMQARLSSRLTRIQARSDSMKPDPMGYTE